MGRFFARFFPAARAHCKRCGVEIKSKTGKELHPLSCKDALKHVHVLYESNEKTKGKEQTVFVCNKCRENFAQTEDWPAVFGYHYGEKHRR